MKTPWKFLAELTSRRRPAETRQSPVGDDADTEASESGARRTSTFSSTSEDVSGSSDRDENPPLDLMAKAPSRETNSDLEVPQAVSLPVEGEEAQTPARHEVGRSGADAHALVPKSLPRKNPPPTKRVGRAKRTRTDMVSESAPVANSDQSVQSSSRRESFFDEVAGLDEEISHLRSQLAQKLRLQNVQLKKMLERFDLS